MKFLILGVIFASVSYIGYQFGNSYKIKENFYNEFSNFIISLKSQINFLKTDLLSIFKEYKTKDKNLKIVLEYFKNNLAENKLISLSILKEEENLEINIFFNGLGKSDCFSQIDYIDRYSEIFDKKLRESKELNLRYGNMYKKLGILFAFFICIVLI